MKGLVKITTICGIILLVILLITLGYVLENQSIKEGEIMSKKFCPECQKLGMESTIYITSCQTTLLAVTQYYDEEGNYHYNDPNKIFTSYKCSNGHEWSD